MCRLSTREEEVWGGGMTSVSRRFVLCIVVIAVFGVNERRAIDDHGYFVCS